MLQQLIDAIINDDTANFIKLLTANPLVAKHTLHIQKALTQRLLMIYSVGLIVKSTMRHLYLKKSV